PEFPARAQIESLNSSEEEMKQFPYLSAVGSIMYLMVGTRPDLAYSLSVLSQYSGRYTKFHWDGVIRVFRYLQHTKDIVLRYDGDSPNNHLHGYSDSDWGGDRE